MTEEQHEITQTGLINLILAIFRYTAQDIRYGSKKNREEALEFLETEFFDHLCSIFTIDKRRIRKMIKENPVSWRDKYE